jgi:hypothetical protein
MTTPSEVGGVLAQIVDGLPRTPDAEGYRRLLTRVANHLLPLAHPPSNLQHAINSRWDAHSSINASVNDDMRMRSGAERSMIEITTSLHDVTP